MQITLGSKSCIKTKAVRAACTALGLTASLKTMAVDSGVSTQPVGTEETERGARTRARKAHAHAPATYGIGIENGIRRGAMGWEDWAVIVIVSPSGAEMIIESCSISLPTEAVEEAAARGFDITTVGQILAERHGSVADDPHSFLSGGTVSRLALLTEALTRALTTCTS